MRKASVVVVGATGAVGQVFLRILEERRFPVDRLRLCASPRSVGKRLTVNGAEVEVEAATPEVFDGADFAFISVSGDISRKLAPIAVKAGALVIDDSSAFRMEPDVPLVVPEVNAEDLRHHKGIASIPNCTTTPVVMVLHPLHQVNPVRRIVADSYQAVSGTGAAAMQELREQSRTLLDGGQVSPSVYPHQIAFNVLPQVERFLEDGYTTEERKMRDETRKIMHAPDIAVSATCVRVPVYVSHSIALHVEFERPMSPDEARELLAAFPGVAVMDDPKASQYPMPWQAEGRDEVFVGRIRKDSSHPNGLAMWVVSDNLRKGAALNAIQIAEEVLKRDLLLGQRLNFKRLSEFDRLERIISAWPGVNKRQAKIQIVFSVANGRFCWLTPPTRMVQIRPPTGSHSVTRRLEHVGDESRLILQRTGRTEAIYRDPGRKLRERWSYPGFMLSETSLTEAVALVRQAYEQVQGRPDLSERGERIAPAGSSVTPVSGSRLPYQPGAEKDERAVFDADCQWFAEHKDELLAQYRGQFAAILDHKVVDSDPAFEKLARRVFKKYGCRDLLMPWVGEEAGPLEIPTPWITGS